MLRRAHPSSQDRKDHERDESQNLAAPRRRDRGANHQVTDQRYADTPAVEQEVCPLIFARFVGNPIRRLSQTPHQTMKNPHSAEMFAIRTYH
jgi:hypothetical protein